MPSASDAAVQERIDRGGQRVQATVSPFAPRANAAREMRRDPEAPLNRSAERSPATENGDVTADLRRAYTRGDHADVLRRATDVLDGHWQRLDSTAVHDVTAMARDAATDLHRSDLALHYAHLARYYSRHLSDPVQATATIRLAGVQMHSGTLGEVIDLLGSARAVLTEARSGASTRIARCEWHRAHLRFHTLSILRDSDGDEMLEKARTALASAREIDIYGIGPQLRVPFQVELNLAEAVVADASGHLQRAQAAIERAQRRASDADGRKLSLRVQHVVAEIDRRRGNSTKAMTAFEALAEASRAYPYFRATALAGLAETAASIGEVKRAQKAMQQLRSEGAHREHQRALRAVVKSSATGGYSVETWGLIALLVMVMTGGWSLVLRQRSENASRPRLYVRDTAKGEDAWVPIDPGSLVEHIRSNVSPQDVMDRVDRWEGDATSDEEETPGTVVLEFPKKMSVAVASPGACPDPGSNDANNKTPGPNASDPVSGSTNVNVECVDDEGHKRPPVQIPERLSDTFTKNRLFGLQVDAGVVLFYRLNAPGEKIIHVGEDKRIDWRPADRIMGVPIALIQA
ncbi:hypothetical protein [Longibacter sp.]|uniref:hypothetical protein n=1 Tax=Longibacter sp. TaxID=2045415 RepID=UPI003EBFC121